VPTTPLPDAAVDSWAAAKVSLQLAEAAKGCQPAPDLRGLSPKAPAAMLKGPPDLAEPKSKGKDADRRLVNKFSFRLFKMNGLFSAGQSRPAKSGTRVNQKSVSYHSAAQGDQTSL
jgi:hypothetical protein